MKILCDNLNEHVTRITNYKMKPMDPLTEEEKKNHIKIKSYVIYARKNFVPIIIKK